VLIHFTVNICASIIGVSLSVLVALLLTVSLLILAFDKRFGWFHPMGFDSRLISSRETK